MNKKPISINRNKDGELCLHNIKLDDLAQQYGTPLYILCEETIRKNCRSYTAPLKQHYPDHNVIYASKANLNIGLANLMVEEGLGLDVVSGGELYTVLQTNVERNKIYFHGNNKSEYELQLAIENNVKIVIDNVDELESIASLTTPETPAQLLIRLKPEIDAHTHDYIKTGNIDSKFGIDQQDLLNAFFIEKNTQSSPLIFCGIHSHIGSQIFDIKPFEELVVLMVQHLVSIKKAFDIDVKELNLGGGIGIKYTEEDSPLDLEPFIKTITAQLISECKKHAISLPKLCFEPGRSIIGNAGLTLYKTGLIKDIPNVKSYIFVDGGMADNPRPIIYKSKYTFDVSKNPENNPKKTYSIAGKFCESGDILAEDISLPEIHKHDTIVVYGTGAYNYSMSSNYNRACKPAMILVGENSVKEIIRRETFEDLIRLDM